MNYCAVAQPGKSVYLVEWLHITRHGKYQIDVVFRHFLVHECQGGIVL